MSHDHYQGCLSAIVRRWRLEVPRLCYSLPGLVPVLVNVIFETIERIREQDDTVLLMEQHALAAFEIADYLYVPEFGKLNMLGDAPKLLDESFVTAANLEGLFGESDRL